MLRPSWPFKSSLAKILEVGDTIIFDKFSGGVARLKLIRPASLNALTIAQTNFIHANLTGICKDSKFLVFSASGDRAFCAGGDVVSMSEWATKKSGNTEWFGIEYCLNMRLSQLPISMIAMWRGVVMGGGVGLGIYGSHRIATDTTVFAMPETNIGFHPDVGASFFLPRLTYKFPGLGLYLALTGSRVFGSDVKKFGFATHFVPTENMNGLEEALLQLDSAEKIESTIAEFSAEGEERVGAHAGVRSHANAKLYDDEELLKISEHFGQPEKGFEFLWSNLVEKSNADPFAKETVKVLRTKCPLTVRVAFEMYCLGSRASESVATCLDREFEVSVYLTQEEPGNFIEGVRAQVIEKGKGAPPAYRPATIEEVTDDMVNKVLNARAVTQLGLAEMDS